ncbi:MAG: hypothetical protein QCI38_09100, partial [Candidatus Thermoplasmatota archaeon]|nr:hypothetical protein [Candidatus Thermoplasmatota archaeon]
VLINAPKNTVEAGEELVFTAEARDIYGNLITDHVGDFGWFGSTNNGVFNHTNLGGLPSMSIGVVAVLNPPWDPVASNTFTVTVTPAPVFRIELTPDEETINADGYKDFFATAYDQYDNKIYDAVIDFSTNDTQATIVSIPNGARFYAHTAGYWHVTAEYGTVTETVHITVVPGARARIAITDETYTWIGARTMTLGQSLDLYAKAYDAKGNLIGNVSVTWSTTGDLGAIPVGPAHTTTFTALNAPATGKILADDGQGLTNLTATITVSEYGIDYITIEDAPDGSGSTIAATSMTTDETITVHALAYNNSFGFIGTISVTWTVTGSLDAAGLPPGKTTSFTFNPTTAGTSGTIRADDGMGNANETGIITVNVGALEHVVITDSPGGTPVG